MMDIPRTSIRRIIAEDLKLQPFKKIKGQRIDTRTKEKRIERCQNLLRVFTKQVLETAFFSDEKIFKVTQLLNVQNDCTYAPSVYKKSTIENKRLYVERSGFPTSLMVSVAVYQKLANHPFSSLNLGQKLTVLTSAKSCWRR